MTYPSWRYGPNGEARICNSEADVPEGWVDHPSGPEAVPAAPQANPFDHDGDGKAGGSEPGRKVKRRGDSK